MTRKFLLCAMLVAGCATAHAQHASPSRPGGAVSAPATLLKAFQKDIAMCADIASQMADDPELVQALIPEASRTCRPVSSFMQESPHANSMPYQYLMRNAESFEIDVSMHGYPYAVAWVPGEAIYCAPTFARLKAIETLGESAQAWQVRRFFLDRMLQGLEHPSDEMEGGQVGFDELKSSMLEAKRRYSSAQRPAFVAWARNAIKVVEASREKIVDGAAGLSAERQSRMIDDRVTFLRSLAYGHSAR